MLVSPHDREINHRVLIVRVSSQSFKQLLPATALDPPAKSGVNVFPREKSFRQIAPRYARPVTVKHRFNKQAIVLRRYPGMAIAARQKLLDPITLIVPQSITTDLSATN